MPNHVTNVVTFKGDENRIREVLENIKDEKLGISYCVQLGAKHVDSVTMSQIKLNEDEKKYYPETLQRNHLNYATIYAYKGTTKYGYTWKEELVASQCLIWAISGKYFDSSTTSLGTNETKLLNCIKAPSTSAKNNMIGDTTKVTPIFTPAQATNKKVTWSSNREDRAIVDKNGVVTGRSPGAVIIKCVSDDGGLSAACMIVVTE